MFLTSLYRGVRLAVFACTLAFAATAVCAQSVALPGHLPSILGSAQRLDRVAAEEQVSLALVLPLRNQDQLADLLHRLYTPGDLLYGKYLTPQQFAEQFSPTQADYNLVLAFAQAQGLTVTNTHSNRTVVDVTGSAQNIENAFGLQLDEYQANGGRVFRAPSNEPQIPAPLVGRLAAVIGLDDATVWKTHNREKPAPAGAQALAFNPHQIGSGPGGGLTPSDIKTAYSLNSIGANGAGQTLGLFELTGYTAGDITAYENYFGLPSVPLQNVLVDGVSGAPGSGVEEVTLDIELQIALAPAISKIYVYEGPNSSQGAIDTYNKIATDNVAKSISTSWGAAESSMSSSVRGSENQAFQQMATQGQSIFAASGDDGAYDNGSTLGVDDPSSQPYMTGVGGTSLTTAGAGGAWSAETTWNNGSASAGAGGGGVSVVWQKPSYQSTFGTSSTNRNVPDVSLDANPNTGYSIYVNGAWSVYGGTSCAAPLWSAFAACVNQSRVAAAKGTLGFANPLLYQLGASGNYKTDFHDVADNSTNLYYHATTGYDNATGFGSILGAGLFPDLVNGGPVSASNTSSVYQIDSGGGAVGSFSADAYYTGGTSYGTNQTIDLTGVTNAAPEAVYQSMRGGNSLGLNFTYSLPGLTPGASYTVRLHFADYWSNQVGGRLFNVLINNTAALTNFDIYAVAGAPNRAVVQDCIGIADSTGKLTLSFVGVTAPALVNGIEILSGSSGSSNLPSAPTGLTATAGNAQVSLSWTAVSGATSYNVKRSLTSGSGYTTIAANITPTSYVNTGLTNGTTYYYVVTAVNSAGESAKSNQASATPVAPAPNAPTGLTATAGNAQVSLSWTAVSGATSYNVKRSLTSGSGYTTIAANITPTSYVDTGLTNGTTYYYVVTAVNTSGASGNSNQVSATPTAPASGSHTVVYQIDSGGGAVGSFSADAYYTGGTSYGTNQTIDLTGVTNAAPEAVYQSMRGGNSLGLNFTYSVPGLTPGASYTVRLHFADYWSNQVGGRLFNVLINNTAALTNFDIYAVAGAPNRAVVQDCIGIADSTGKLTLSFVGVTAPALVNGIEILSGSSGSSNLPSAPTGLTATAGNAQVSLSWTAVSGATSYNVKRSLTSGSGYSVVGTSTTASYVDTSVTNGTTYYYVVTAVNSAGESANSNQASATPTAPASGSHTVVYQIDSGGGAVGSFSADAYYTGGTSYGTNQTIDLTGVTNAAPEAVYQSMRGGNSLGLNFTYSVPGLTPGASYTVRLHFADYWSNQVGGRLFNVLINNTAALTNFDIYAVAGAPNRAVVQDCIGIADSTGKLTLSFIGVTAPALVNGIEILH